MREDPHILKKRQDGCFRFISRYLMDNEKNFVNISGSIQICSKLFLYTLINILFGKKRFAFIFLCYSIHVALHIILLLVFLNIFSTSTAIMLSSIGCKQLVRQFFVIQLYYNLITQKQIHQVSNLNRKNQLLIFHRPKTNSTQK